MAATPARDKDRADRSAQPGVEQGVKQGVNEVHLVGRVAATATTRTLPSGDVVTLLRLVVERPAGQRHSDRSPTVDTLDCAVWSPRIRQRVESLEPGTIVEVDGALRLRFWRSPAGPASRYEVEVIRLRRQTGARRREAG